MSGSPKTVKRLPAPVFFSSSSPIARSGFMRASITGSLPYWRSLSATAKPPPRSFPSLDAGANSSVFSPAWASKAKPQTTSRS